MQAPVLLTVRGKLAPSTLDAARILHNETAGSARGMEAARALSDLSHCVYAPSEAGALSGAVDGELLFLDRWADPAGLAQFFADKDVAEQGAKLFSSRDGSVWMPARGAFTFSVPATYAMPPRTIGLFRAKVKSPEAAIDAFAGMVSRNLRVSRRRGLVSHELFVKLGPPSDAPEIVGIDFWASKEGLIEHYSDRTAMTGLDAVLAGAPEVSVWEQASGFNEW